MKEPRRVFLLFADEGGQADMFLHDMKNRAHVRVITLPEDRRKIIGLDVEDTPWLSIRRNWTKETRDIYDVVRLRFGPVWSTTAWIEALEG